MVIKIWLITAFATVGVSGEFCFHNQNETEFNPATHQCCQGIGVIPIRDENNQTLGCCGKTTYHTEYQFCCNDRVYHSNSGVLQCCGADVWDTDIVSLCCNGTVRTNISGNDRCCGSGVYNPLEQICCSNDVTGNYNIVNRAHGNVACCCETPINTTYEYCNSTTDCVVKSDQFGYSRLSIDSCGGVEYDMKNDKCCNEKIIPGIAEDDDTYQCCGEKVIKPAENESCCHGEDEYSESALSTIYNTQNERCCAGTLHNITSQHQGCCGNNIMDKTTSGCCALKIYDRSTEQCCQGTNLTSKSKQCCGSVPYDNNTQICCESSKPEVINKTTCDDETCCKKLDGNTKCGEEEYDEDNDLCCHYKLFKNARKHGYECCPSPEPLVNCSGICSAYNESERCSWNDEDDQQDDIRGNYDICKVCNGLWDTRLALTSLYKGQVDVCRQSAMVLTTIRSKKIPRMTKLQLIIRENRYDESDVFIRDYKLTAFLPCRCNYIIPSEELLLISNIQFGKRIRLGDSDVLLPYSENIVEEVIRRKLLCQ